MKQSEKAMTPEQWLTQSVGWSGCCLGGWLLFASLLIFVEDDSQHGIMLWTLMLGSAVLAHVLVWWKAFPGVWSWPANSASWLQELAVRTWISVLTLAQVATMLLLLAAISIAFGCDVGGGWGNITG